jgi:ubiquinone/menaquinone biosynthesis C-methylase UbiE
MGDVSPMSFFDGLFFGYQTTAALKAAVELDLFTSIAEGADTPEAIAARTGAAARGARILADYLVVRGYLTKQDGRYRLTPDSAAFLDRRSPTYVGGVADFLAAPENIALMLNDPAATVRAGGSPGLSHIASDNPVWVKFARAMVPFVAPIAQAVAAQVREWPAPPRQVLDIAAGHGMFGLLLAQALPEARITAVDWEGVLSVARENATRMGVSDRFRTVAGNAFEVDWGADYDLVLLPNFLHHFEPERCVQLLRKVRASLAPGGRVLAVEFVPNADRVSPPMPAMFAFVMLMTTPHGDAYTEAELDAMAREAGFRGIAAAPQPPSPQTLIEFLV